MYVFKKEKKKKKEKSFSLSKFLHILLIKAEVFELLLRLIITFQFDIFLGIWYPEYISVTVVLKWGFHIKFSAEEKVIFSVLSQT